MAVPAGEMHPLRPSDWRRIHLRPLGDSQELPELERHLNASEDSVHGAHVLAGQ